MSFYSHFRLPALLLFRPAESHQDEYVVAQGKTMVLDHTDEGDQDHDEDRKMIIA